MYIICGLIANTTNVHKHNSFVLYTYSYCVYALVGGGGGEISIHGTYIYAVLGSVPKDRMLSSTELLSVQ